MLPVGNSVGIARSEGLILGSWLGVILPSPDVDGPLLREGPIVCDGPKLGEKDMVGPDVAVGKVLSDGIMLGKGETEGSGGWLFVGLTLGYWAWLEGATDIIGKAVG